MFNTTKLVFRLFSSLLVLVCLGNLALAQGTPTITVSASAVCAGIPLSVSASGCNNGYIPLFTVYEIGNSSAIDGGTGDYTFDEYYSPGSYSITVECIDNTRIGGDKATNVSSTTASTTVTINESPNVSFGPRSEPRLTCTTPSLPLYAANESNHSRTTNKSMTSILSLTVVQPDLTTQTGNLDQTSSDPTPFTVNQAGSYTLLTSNSNGCTVRRTTEVTSSTSTVAINSFVASGTITCSLSSSATLTAALGAADRMPYSSTVVQPDGSNQTILQDGNPNPSFTVTQVGTYTLLVSDSNGCISFTTTTVSSESSVLNVSVTPATSTIKKGESVTLTASGADSYQWSTSEAGESITVHPETTATISVTGTDRETGCFNVAQATIQVQTPRALEAASPAINNPVLVLSSSNCPITFTAKGWGKSFVITSPNGYVFSNVFRDFIVGGDIVGEGIKKPGTYTLTVFGDEDQTPVTYRFEVTGTGCN